MGNIIQDINMRIKIMNKTINYNTFKFLLNSFTFIIINWFIHNLNAHIYILYNIVYYCILFLMIDMIDFNISLNIFIFIYLNNVFKIGLIYCNQFKTDCFLD